jgi:hypothetical protein
MIKVGTERERNAKWGPKKCQTKCDRKTFISLNKCKKTRKMKLEKEKIRRVHNENLMKL